MKREQALNIVEFFKSKLSKYELFKVEEKNVKILDIELIDIGVLIYFNGDEKIAALEHFEGEDGDMIQIVYMNSTILTDDVNLCRYIIERIE